MSNATETKRAPAEVQLDEGQTTNPKEGVSTMNISLARTTDTGQDVPAEIREWLEKDDHGRVNSWPFAAPSWADTRSIELCDGGAFVIWDSFRTQHGDASVYLTRLETISASGERDRGVLQLAVCEKDAGDVLIDYRLVHTLLRGIRDLLGEDAE